jgi:hypothetical protein
MAATALTAQIATHAGLEIAYSTPTQTTGHTAPCGTGLALLVKNSSGGVDVFLHVPGQVDGLAVATPSGGTVASRKVTVATGKDELIPLTSYYADPTTGLCVFDLSATANTTFACVSAGG